MLLRVMVVTIQATLLCMGIARVLGLAFSLLKMVPLRIVTWPVNFILECARNTPLLVQLYFLYFVLPDFGIVFPAFLTGAIALGLQYCGYTAEVYRRSEERRVGKECRSRGGAGRWRRNGEDEEELWRSDGAGR